MKLKKHNGKTNTRSKKVLEKLDKEIREKQSKYVSLIKSLMDDFKRIVGGESD